MSDNAENLKRILEIVKDKVDVSEMCEVPEIVTQESHAPTVQRREVVSVNRSEDTQTDYKFVRENLHNIIDKGSLALDYIIRIAENSEKAFAFDTVASVLKTLVDTNKELIQLHRTITKIESESGEGAKPKNQNTNIENAVFIGSTADLNDIIKKKKQDDEMF